MNASNKIKRQEDDWKKNLYSFFFTFTATFSIVGGPIIFLFIPFTEQSNRDTHHMIYLFERKWRISLYKN